MPTGILVPGMNRHPFPRMIVLLAALAVPVLAQEKEKMDPKLSTGAKALLEQKKYPEAGKAFTELIALQTRILGADHPDTLGSRGDLAIALDRQRKFPEAEKEYRSILAGRERVLKPDDPRIWQTCHNLALNLALQKKFPEALIYIQRAETGWTKTLGPEHPFTKSAVHFHELIEADSKKQPQPREPCQTGQTQQP